MIGRILGVLWLRYPNTASTDTSSVHTVTASFRIFKKLMLWLFLNLMVISPQSWFNPSSWPGGASTRNANLCISDQAASVEWLTVRDHDFGKMRRERPQKFVFRFKNLNAKPILLETVRTTCGCTAAKWTEAPIEPGETGEIEVEYDAYQRGGFSKKIRVYFDSQRKPEILWIRGEVE